MSEDPRLYQIGLTMVEGVGSILGRQLLQAFGSAEAIFREKTSALERVPGIGKALAAAVKRPEVLLRAERELAFAEKNRITLYFLSEAGYPRRLRECTDAPLLCYGSGHLRLDVPHVVSLVGTRRATPYGKERVEQLLADLAARFPELLVVSGLAYGIDICAHRNALLQKLPTVAVLAHGLDRIYPSAHRSTAVEMLAQGGLLTDFPSGTNPDRMNFVSRNRIIAGLADVTVVIESAEKGGSLITAELANSYGRDVYSFPGRVKDPFSQGCNALIREHKAGLITSADDLIRAMRWDLQENTAGKKLPEQTQLLFPENEEQGQILTLLRREGEMHINRLAVALGLPVQQLSPLLFEMELAGTLKALPGNVYKPL